MYRGGGMEGEPLLIAPQVDSRNNRKATQSLTQLVIINQAQLLTYALSPHSPFQYISPSFSLCTIFFPFCFTPSLAALCVFLGQPEEQDEVINYIPTRSLVVTRTFLRRLIPLLGYVCRSCEDK